MNTPITNQAAIEVASLAQDVVSQYFTHVAAMYVARDPKAAKLAPPIAAGESNAILRIPRRDGTNISMLFHHYLRANNDSLVKDSFDKLWLRGALLTMNDALGDNGYFGHAPEAEMIRHLRNGIGHRNRFTFGPGVINKRTGKLKHPANTFRQWKLYRHPRHEIDTHLEGTEVLWTWGGPDGVIDCLMALFLHLKTLGSPCGEGVATVPPSATITKKK